MKARSTKAKKTTQPAKSKSTTKVEKVDTRTDQEKLDDWRKTRKPLLKPEKRK